MVRDQMEMALSVEEWGLATVEQRTREAMPNGQAERVTEAGEWDGGMVFLSPPQKMKKPSWGSAKAGSKA